MISTDIDNIVRRIIQDEEGGYSNDPSDHGGPTKYGITLATLDRWRGHTVSADAVKALGVDDAVTIYRTLYWSRPNLSILPDEISPVVFDMGINAGPTEAIKLLQHTLCDLGYAVGVDGFVGPATSRAAYQAISALGADHVVNTYCDARAKFYGTLCAKDPSQRKFLNGWLTRVDKWRPAQST